ncbi:(4Fe-4S)-binding protein [Robertkochia aurantiaca]|uniref:(4Fe-4S)-binding protein n=1 Tax=Robertkochia aurantiaca TaxID=2873700 RepID=UPI001CC9AECB|nr:(4Fe-4S)-binding protein [Robertkochia sp. 3YJGBD-33]
MGTTKEYSNGEVTVIWKPDLCIHSEVCVKGLSEVFKPDKKPWIQTEAAPSKAIVDQVKKCPSGALDYYWNDKEKKKELMDQNEKEASGIKVEIIENGPLMVYGQLNVEHFNGSSEVKKKATAFCRCGYSENKPYCDGSHTGENFQG